MALTRGASLFAQRTPGTGRAKPGSQGPGPRVRRAALPWLTTMWLRDVGGHRRR